MQKALENPIHPPIYWTLDLKMRKGLRNPIHPINQINPITVQPIGWGPCLLRARDSWIPKLQMQKAWDNVTKPINPNVVQFIGWDPTYHAHASPTACAKPAHPKWDTLLYSPNGVPRASPTYHAHALQCPCAATCRPSRLPAVSPACMGAGASPAPPPAALGSRTVHTGRCLRPPARVGDGREGQRSARAPRRQRRRWPSCWWRGRWR